MPGMVVCLDKCVRLLQSPFNPIFRRVIGDKTSRNEFAGERTSIVCEICERRQVEFKVDFGGI